MSNIKELIRAEIKKRRLHFNKEAEKYQALNNGYSQNCFGARDALRDLENFLDTLPDEPVSNDLKEAAEEYRQGEVDSGCDYIDDSDGDSLYHSACLTDAFISGAEWQKRKMMERAVEGKVFMSFAPGHNQMVMADVDLPTNTKVKIIIVKEEEQ